MTIVQAIQQVLRASGSPLTPNEVYQRITEQHLYDFRAADPAAVVRTQLRRHCEGFDKLAPSAKKHFRLVGKDRYELLS